ncbi:hypothetical protein GCM10018951_05180 [Pseudarthrobacter polychromogenes]
MLAGFLESTPESGFDPLKPTVTLVTDVMTGPINIAIARSAAAPRSILIAGGFDDEYRNCSESNAKDNWWYPIWPLGASKHQPGC